MAVTQTHSDGTAGTALFVWPLRVYYEDTDASGVVYHSHYLQFFERARTEWLRSLGYSHKRMQAEFGVVFTVASVQVDYLTPARLDDAVRVTVAAPVIRHVSLTFEQALYREDILLSRGRFRVACVDAHSFELRRLPQPFRKEFA